MYFTYFIFVILLPVVSSQSATDVLLKKEFNIELDKKCVQDKIGRDKFNSLQYTLAKCSTDITHLYLQDKASVDRNIAAFCGHKDDASACFKEVTETITPCLTENQKNSLKYNGDSKTASVAYACENRALLKDFLTADNSKCQTAEYVARSAKCVSPGILGLTIENVYSKENCRVMETFTKCAADNLRSCSGETASKFSTGMFYAGANATPCKEYVSGGTGNGNGGTGSGSGGGGTQNKVNGCNAMAWLSNVLIAVISICCWLPNVFF